MDNTESKMENEVMMVNVGAASISAATPTLEEPNSVEMQFTSLLQEMTQLKSGINDIFTKFRLLEKAVTKELKVKPPPATKKKAASVKTSFDIPAPLSDKLCQFMGLPEGSEMSHTEVTQYILNYIQKLSPSPTKSRNEIIPDEALSQLFGAELTYFNLPKCISLHLKIKN
jgi:hypothetical protein